MSRNRTYQPSFGSISSGTMRPADLIPTFAEEIRRIVGNTKDCDIRRILSAAATITNYDSEDAQYLLDQLFDFLNDYAPAYGYFGAHEGDGADYGYWIADDAIDAFDGLKVDDLADIPADYVGEAMVINDHGNVTLYVVTDRPRFKVPGQPGRLSRFREVWAIV